MLKNWKTYLAVIGGCAAVVAEYFGVISHDMRNTALAVAGLGGLAGLRSALKQILTDVTGVKLPQNEAKSAVSSAKPEGWK